MRIALLFLILCRASPAATIYNLTSIQWIDAFLPCYCTPNDNATYSAISHGEGFASTPGLTSQPPFMTVTRSQVDAIPLGTSYDSGTFQGGVYQVKVTNCPECSYSAQLRFEFDLFKPVISNPEPASLTLSSGGLLILLLIARSRRVLVR